MVFVVNRSQSSAIGVRVVNHLSVLVNHDMVNVGTTRTDATYGIVFILLWREPRVCLGAVRILDGTEIVHPIAVVVQKRVKSSPPVPLARVLVNIHVIYVILDKVRH